MREGIDPPEARRRARRALGNLTLQAERTRDADVALWLDALVRHLRVALRSLRRTTGFRVAVVLTLAPGAARAPGVASRTWRVSVIMPTAAR